jgi:hypothetical protein
MPYPQIRSISEDNDTAAGDPVVDFVNNTGDRVVILLSLATAQTISVPAGWVNHTNRNGRLHVIYKDLTGSEGTSVTVTVATNCKFSAIIYHITTNTFDATVAPTLSSVGSGTSANPDPPNCNPGTAADYLWIAGFAHAGEELDDDTWCNSAPTNFGTLSQKTSGTGGTSASNCSIATADRSVNASSQDPGTFNTDQSLAYESITVAIHPTPIIPTGITSGEAFGTTKVNLTLHGTGIASAEVFGTLKVNQEIDLSGAATPVTDDFNRSDGTLITGDWSGARFEIVGNEARITDTAQWCFAYRNSGTYANDQYAEVTVVDGTGMTADVNVGVGPSVRNSGEWNGYFLTVTADAIRINKFVEGVGPTLDLDTAAITLAVGDRIRIEVEGTTIRGYQNDVLKVEVTDSSHASGRPGVAGRIEADEGALSNTDVDDWEGGDLGGAGGGIASTEAFGNPTVSIGAGNQTITCTGIASTEAFGTLKVNQTIHGTGIASTEAFGTTKIVLTVHTTGIASTEAFGTPQLNLIVRLTGIASTETFGTTTVVADQFITCTGIASTEAFGTLQVNRVLISGTIASAEAFGTTSVVKVITCSGIASTETFGTATVKSFSYVQLERVCRGTNRGIMMGGR